LIRIAVQRSTSRAGHGGSHRGDGLVHAGTAPERRRRTGPPDGHSAAAAAPMISAGRPSAARKGGANEHAARLPPKNGEASKLGPLKSAARVCSRRSGCACRLGEDSGASNAGHNQWRPLPPPSGLRASRRGAANEVGRGLAMSSPDRGWGAGRAASPCWSICAAARCNQRRYQCKTFTGAHILSLGES
jgi:hypothetical protein